MREFLPFFIRKRAYLIDKIEKLSLLENKKDQNFYASQVSF